MSSIREKFVETFDGNTAALIEQCAEQHADGNRGSDEFRWAIAITIGYQCWELDGYREYHGFNPEHTYESIRSWVIEHGDLAHHDGDVDVLAALVGSYEDYVAR